MKYTSKRNIHTPEARRLKYCNRCKHVWEKGCNGTILKHLNLPTYRLPRVYCNTCSKLKAKNESDVWQISEWLSLDGSKEWLKKESKRLRKKGWKVETKEDNRGMVSLWRIK